MSASLVGSEMCIRDSTNAPGGCRIGATAYDRRSMRASLHTRFPVRPRAVSYTHLTLPTICSV
eukprot:3796759-Alexandrium_andersonii.AAC.1